MVISQILGIRQKTNFNNVSWTEISVVYIKEKNNNKKKMFCFAWNLKFTLLAYKNSF